MEVGINDYFTTPLPRIKPEQTLMMIGVGQCGSGRKLSKSRFEPGRGEVTLVELICEQYGLGFAKRFD
jgi:hypothetical protein